VFTDWGRDTFIALRGLCLATDDATTPGRSSSSGGAVSDGMLPNRFPDQGAEPSSTPSMPALWYVVAVHEFLAVAEGVAARDREALEAAVQAILSGYARGTRYGIRADDDGLLAAGEPGVQLTWMDAKVATGW